MSIITIVFRATVREGKVEEFFQIAKNMVSESRKETGCITYVFHQSIEMPNQFMLYEQWENEGILMNHIELLIKEYGKPNEGEIFPCGLTDFWETKSAEFYEIVE